MQLSQDQAKDISQLKSKLEQRETEIAKLRESLEGVGETIRNQAVMHSQHLKV